jgi:hypothetical protein
MWLKAAMVCPSGTTVIIWFMAITLSAPARFSTTNVIFLLVRLMICDSFLNAISLPAPGALPITTVTVRVGSQDMAMMGTNNKSNSSLFILKNICTPVLE